MITKWESGYILKVYIGADFVPTDINRTLFENGDMESIIGTQVYDMLFSDTELFIMRSTS